MAHSDMSFDGADSTDQQISLDDMHEADDTTDTAAQQRQMILHPHQHFFNTRKQSPSWFFFFFSVSKYSVNLLN